MSNSIRSRIFGFALKLSGYKKTFTLSADELLEKARKSNEKNKISIPTDKNFIYADFIVNEKHHCFKIQKEEQSAKKALLFFFGGGFINGCTTKAVNSAKQYCERTGRDVWLPQFPLCTDHCITETYDMVYATYKEMLKIYEPQNIAFIGFSSGGALALGLGCHINALKEENVSLPGLIISVSPGSVPHSEEEKQKMEELNSFDVMLDKKFMCDVIKDIMTKGQKVPDYMVHTVLGDYSNFPMTHIYYATHEILYAEAEHFEKAFKKYNIKYEMHIKEGLFHCYPSIPLYPEGKEAIEQIIGYLNE